MSVLTCKHTYIHTYIHTLHIHTYTKLPFCSKYVPRGSVRIHTDTVGTTLENIGFITPDKEVVVVIMNTGDESVKFKLKDYDHARAVNVTALPHSIQTFIYSY